MAMRKSQEEINIITALLIPALAFLLLLVVLYVNMLPVIDPYMFALLFAHDVGTLVDSAYASPGNIRFVYSGPIPCKPDYSKGVLNCTKGSSWIAMGFGSGHGENYKVETALYDLLLGNPELVANIPKVAFVNIPFTAKIRKLTGTMDIEGTSTYFSEPSTYDFMMRKGKSIGMYLANGGVVIRKVQKNFFGTISYSNKDNLGVDFIMSKVLDVCESGQEETFDITLLPRYVLYYNNLKLCMAELDSSNNPRDIECYNFNRMDGCTVSISSDDDEFERDDNFISRIGKFNDDHSHKIRVKISKNADGVSISLSEAK